MPIFSLEDVANHLDRSALDMKFRLDAEVRTMMEEGAELAASYIGQERPQWDPLAPSTIAEKTRLGFVGHVSATDPLLRSGELHASIQGEAEATPDGVTGVIGSADIIALYQEMGTKTIPPRPFLFPAMIRVQPVAEVVLGELASRAVTPRARL